MSSSFLGEPSGRTDGPPLAPLWLQTRTVGDGGMHWLCFWWGSVLEFLQACGLPSSPAGFAPSFVCHCPPVHLQKGLGVICMQLQTCVKVLKVETDGSLVELVRLFFPVTILRVCVF